MAARAVQQRQWCMVTLLLVAGVVAGVTQWMSVMKVRGPPVLDPGTVGVSGQMGARPGSAGLSDPPSSRSLGGYAGNPRAPQPAGSDGPSFRAPAIEKSAEGLPAKSVQSLLEFADGQMLACGLSEDGYHYAGDEVARIHDVKTAEKCCALCTGEVSCHSWTWGKLKGHKDFRFCSMKAQAGADRTRDDCCVSGMPAHTPYRDVLADRAAGAASLPPLSPAPAVVKAQPRAKPSEGQPWPGCSQCCVAGHDYVPCLDVTVCAKEAQEGGKYALVLSQWLPLESLKHLKNLEAMRKQADEHGLDIVMLMLKEHVSETTEDVHAMLREKGVRIEPVDWDLPPGSWVPVMKDGQIWRPGREGWCGPMDLMRMHIFALEGYDAVAYFDSDMELQGDVTETLRCASTGVLLTTSGPLAPVSVAIIAVRPDRRLLEASMAFARNATFSRLDGWAGGGYLPTTNKYIGAECGQGFFHTLFYMPHINKLARWALNSAGISDLRAAQLDRCIWNYQGGENCGKAGQGFDCDLVRVHHKPKAPTAGCCTKIRERTG